MYTLVCVLLEEFFSVHEHNCHYQFFSDVITTRLHVSILLLLHICCVFESITCVFCVPQSQSSDFTRPDTFELYLQVILEFTKHQSQVNVNSVIKSFTLGAAGVRLGWTMAVH